MIVVVAISASILTRYLGAKHEQPMVVQSSRSVLVQQPKTIAVLPLVELSPSGGNDYIGDGLAQELSSRLARIPGLRVASQTSAFAYKGKPIDASGLYESRSGQTVKFGGVRDLAEYLTTSGEAHSALPQWA